jgi:hypothetical protein
MCRVGPTEQCSGRGRRERWSLAAELSVGRIHAFSPVLSDP